MIALNKRNVAIGLTTVLFLAVALGSILMTEWSAGAPADINNIELGTTLFDTYAIAVLMVGFVLFVSLLGGVFIAQEEDEQ